jgi:hypothetical protein
MSQCPVELCLASRINECTLGHFVDHELLEFEARVRISTYLSDVYFLGQGTMAMFFSSKHTLLHPMATTQDILQQI